MGSPTKFFGTVRQKVLTENRDISPPLILIFFRDQKFSEAQIRKVSLRNFSALWDKIFDTKSWHNSMKPKIFRNPKLLTHWSVPLRSFSALSDKMFWQKIVIFPPPRPLILIFFRDQNFSEAQIRKVSLRNFSALWDKIFDTNSWHNSLKPKIFRNPKLMTHWWVPLRSFSALSDKKFWQKIVIFPPPSYPYLFSRPEIFRSTDQEGFSTKFFGTVRQNFRHKIVT